MYDRPAHKWGEAVQQRLEITIVLHRPIVYPAILWRLISSSIWLMVDAAKGFEVLEGPELNIGVPGWAKPTKTTISFIVKDISTMASGQSLRDEIAAFCVQL